MSGTGEKSGYALGHSPVPPLEAPILSSAVRCKVVQCLLAKAGSKAKVAIGAATTKGGTTVCQVLGPVRCLTHVIILISQSP